MGGGNTTLNRDSLCARDIVEHIWLGLSLPASALDQLTLQGADCAYPSSFKISEIAHSATALSALSAALVDSIRDGRKSRVRRVSVPLKNACLKYKAESLYTLDGNPPEHWSSAVGGLHQTKDGYVRIHDAFPNHRDGALKLLGLSKAATREQVDAKVLEWGKLELEQKAHDSKLAIYALRSYEEWDATPQAQAVTDFPIKIRKISPHGPKGLPAGMRSDADRCLRGLKVVELSRVIAAPVAGKTLASHGADISWVTSPRLPDLPSLDPVFSRGKRRVHLDLNVNEDHERLKQLVRECDVFLQGYRPGGVSGRGFGAAEVAEMSPGIIYANMSAFGPDGPWSDRRGFDSLVQTSSGIQVSEAEHYGANEPARPMACQALDHTSGLFLATGICAALYRRATEGGSWEVHVSLAGTMKYLRSLGQWPGKEGFSCVNPAASREGIEPEFFDTVQTDYGLLRSIREAARVEGVSS